MGLLKIFRVQWRVIVRISDIFSQRDTSLLVLQFDLSCFSMVVLWHLNTFRNVVRYRITERVRSAKMWIRKLVCLYHRAVLGIHSVMARAV